MMHKTPTDVTSCVPRATLLGLRHGQCRWPIGDPRAEDFALCGAPAEGRYCPRHAARGRARTQPCGPIVLDAAAPAPVRFATHMDRWA